MRKLDFARIGAKIKEQRISLGYKQEYVANILDVNPSHISNIERGRVNPSLTILVEMANIMHCSVDVFLNGEYTFEPEKGSDIEKHLAALIRYKTPEIQEKALKIIEIL